LADIARGLGRPGAPSLAETVGVLATFALFPAVIPEFGGEGAAVVVAAASCAVAILMSLSIRQAMRALPRSLGNTD
jgi:O-antigen/teichoic acid export membrane protein